MTVSFNKQVQPPPVVANKVAMPVGTSQIMAMEKFMFDKRDLNCTSCRNGYRSTIPKMLDGKQYSVGVICTCVPYCLQCDAEGTGVVVYKGRRENWVKGVRPESEIQGEMIREGEEKAAFRDKMNPKKPLSNPDGRNVEANLEKAAQNAARPKQKVMQQDQNGHFILTDLETGKKMGLVVSDVSNPLINPSNPDTAQQDKQQPPPQEQPKGLRPESDEEYLERTTGQKPMVSDPRVITEGEATIIESARIQAAVEKTVPAPQPVPTPGAPARAIPAPTAPAEIPVKRGRGRPKGSVKK